MFAVYNPGTGQVFRYVYSLTGVDTDGMATIAVPQDFTPDLPNYELQGGAWVPKPPPPPPPPPRRPVCIDFHADAGATLTLTNQAAAAQFLANNNRVIDKLDMSLFTQARLFARVVVAGAAGASLRARWHTAFTTTVGTFQQMGDGVEVAASLAAAGFGDSGWLNLTPAAIGDDRFVTIQQIGGDGVADPQIGRVSLWLR